MSDVTLFGGSPFDAIRRVDEAGEHWAGRDLMPVMAYARWDAFQAVIEKASASLALVQGHEAAEANFRQVQKYSAGPGRPGIEYRLTRFGAYLVAMAGDDTKQAVAEARVYFAVRTREAETGRPRELTRLELIDIARDAEVGRLAEMQARELAEAKVAALEPAASSWEYLAARGGDYSLRDAAQVLDRDPAISTGQNRLAAYLREIGWTDHTGQPYQRHVDAGRLRRRATGGYTDSTGEHVATWQPRITVAGLGDLHRRLGGSLPLLATT